MHYLVRPPKITCEVPVGYRKMQALLDMRASILMFWLKELGLTNKELETADLKIVQADGREIQILVG